jgi:hypothetical protein
MDYFPDNTLTHFMTRLPQMMDLDGSWEIGLSEIQYPHSWYDIKKGEAQWYLSVSHHPRFDQWAIHVQRIYSSGYVCYVISVREYCLLERIMSTT